VGGKNEGGVTIGFVVATQMGGGFKLEKKNERKPSRVCQKIREGKGAGWQKGTRNKRGVAQDDYWNLNQQVKKTGLTRSNDKRTKVYIIVCGTVIRRKRGKHNVGKKTLLQTK